MATRKRIFASEREMHAHWSMAAGCCTETRDGEPIRVVYPGIAAGSSGPDYKDAVIAFGGSGMVRGDVELHLCGDDWRRHGHDTDPAYDGVVLHVVAESRSRSRTLTAGGRDVPVVVLGEAACLQLQPELPCAQRAGRDIESVKIVLMRAGVAWLLSRAARIGAQTNEPEPWKLLAHLSARALGYSANAEAALALGRRLTDDGVLALLRQGHQDTRSALVMGIAGLLPSQRPGAGVQTEAYVSQWESAWSRKASGVSSMSASSWRLSGLYPNNSPVRRTAALAGLLLHMEVLADVAPGLVVRYGERPRYCAALLEQHYRVAGDDYWRRHYDFGMRTRKSDLIGASKAREMVVNALLPWVAAGALVSGDSTCLAAAVRLLSLYPPAPAHSITRHMQRQLGFARACGSAGVQQGMLHLFREHCRRGLCASCALSTEAKCSATHGRVPCRQ